MAPNPSISHHLATETTTEICMECVWELTNPSISHHLATETPILMTKIS